MILVLGGTADSRRIAAKIHAEGHSVLVSTATEYGGSLVDGLPVRSGTLDHQGFTELYTREKIRLVVDASHPYAANVSRSAMETSREMGIGYLRYERPSTSLPSNPLIHTVGSFADAAKKSADLGDCVFLGTGSNNLSCFTGAVELRGKRLVARVLPAPEIIQKCLQAGLKPRDIVAMQGPFSTELNKATYGHFGVQVVVSKESGDEGGTDFKVQAALELGIPVVLVERPKLDYPLLVRDWPGLKQCLDSFQSGL